MINFGNLTIKGYGSIADFSINLSQPYTIVVRGRNGSGKSTMVSAISWVLFGKNLKGISEINTWPKYRTKDYKGTMVSLYFVIDNVTYKVIRCQNYSGDIDGAKGKNNLFIYTDAILSKTKGIKNIQRELETILGMSYNLFINSVLFGQGLKRLINETNSDQKALFEEIFDVAFTSKARLIASDNLKVEKGYLNELINKKSVLESQLQAYRENYKYSKEQFIQYEENTNKALARVEDSIQLYKKQLQELRNEYDQELLKTIPIKIERLADKLSKVTHQLKTEATLREKPIHDLIDEVITLIKAKEYDRCIGNLLRIKEASKNYDTLTEKRFTISNKLNKSRSELSSLKFKSEKILKKEKDIKTLKDDIFEIKCQKPVKVNLEAKNKIKDIKKLLKELELNIKPQQTKVNNLEWVINDPLSNHGIKAYLFESSLSALNRILDSYGEVLEFIIQFMIDTTSKKKDFTTVIKFERQFVLYEELSGGQKQLIHLALAFAMNELVSSSLGLNIAFLDEIFESLSEDNIDIVVNLIKHVYKDKTVFLITHHDSLPISNSKTLYTKRINGLSAYTF